jgi:ABC-2 type transport system permease protein
MKDVLALAKSHVVTALRERVTLFWFLVFPAFLLTILTLIFGQVGQEENVHFSITLINHDHAESSNLPFSATRVIEETLGSLSEARESGAQPLFTLIQPAPGSDGDAFLEQELVQIRRGNRAAVLVLPGGFDEAVLSGILDETDRSGATAKLYMSHTSVASETASSIIEQILAEIDRTILIQTGRFDETQAVAVVTDWIGQEEEETRYVDFVLPGIILMGFFTNGLFGVPGTILFNRDRKVLRRYWVTPLSVGRYLAGFGLGHLSLCVVQFALLFALGKYAFGATIQFTHPLSIIILVLAAITFMAFGFFIAALAKSANAGMAVANILNMPMMFLSGMFFPLVGLPIFMMVIVYANPVIYLLEALRQSVGVQTSTLMPFPWTFIVPLFWIALCSLVTIRRLRWDVAR